MSDHWQGKGGSKGAYPGSVKAETGPGKMPASSNPAGGKLEKPSGNTPNK